MSSSGFDTLDLWFEILKHCVQQKCSIVMTFLVRECYGSPKKQEFKKKL
jgi:hypothetical protein